MSKGIKGGTIIAEDVLDLADHEERLLDPDSYRPEECRNCGHDKIHAHCFRERILREADPREPPLRVDIRLFSCASCRAVFTILPAFIARHLWRAWETVERVARGEDLAPKETMDRWFSRLESDASQLVQVFTASVQGAVSDALLRRRPSAREAFIALVKPFLGRRSSLFARLGAWIHRLEAGVRLM
ncbi:MAG: hypothetical protein ACE5FG_15945 [Myxococcota bacterium]